MEMMMKAAYVEIVAIKPWTRWGEGLKDVAGYQRDFVRRLIESPKLSGRVLDIGCGGNLLESLLPLAGKCGSLDGVDPAESVWSHPFLTRRWQGILEASDIPAATYDVAYAFNVLEHIGEPAKFFEKVALILKPGGVFWGLTQNAGHLFPKLSRLIELSGLKPMACRLIGTDNKENWQVNAYPAYYRCNSPQLVQSAIQGLPFQRVTFFYYPVLGWGGYFPRLLRWVPDGYDVILGARVPKRFLMFFVRLEKAG